ncbi:hypothetical protein N8467_00440 [bacterium]|nr:hypothetical protein [bacterium]
MIKLLNGNGQMGNSLKHKLSFASALEEVLIYHTWNIEDKSTTIQQQEHSKFITFVKKSKNKRIIFISTSSEKENSYVKYKQLSESFLLENHNNCLVLRLPTIIGKGVFYGFKDSLLLPYGEMNIVSMDQACDFVLKNLNYKGLLKIKTLDGHKIDAKTVYELVRL